MALTKLTKNLIDGTFGTEWDSTIQTSNFTAVAGKGYFVNTTSGEITVTLPAGVVGTEIVIQDYAGTFATNKVLLNANGSEKIQGDSTIQGQITTNNATATLVYQDATKGWTSQDVGLVPQVVNTTYLVIAGGGAGGYTGGGGGAGGYRNSYASETSGGGGSTETPLILNFATNYNVTIGGGGAPVNTYHVQAGSGTNSVFSTITASGGGGAGNHSTADGADGGSGGGACSSGSSRSGGAAVTSPVVQGYAGGDNSTSSPNYGAGGGGGAGAVGVTGTPTTGGNGGAGLSSSITGSAITRAGGGGGCTQSGGTAGTGGTGGGSDGTNSNTTASDGSTNTGGGAGGGGWGSNTSGSGGTGGSGIVILRYTNTATLTNPGAGLTLSTAPDGSDKVTTITAGTGNIQLN